VILEQWKKGDARGMASWDRRDPDLENRPDTHVINNRIIKIEQIIISNLVL